MKLAIMPNMTRVKAHEVTSKICARLDMLNIEYVFSEEMKNHFPEFPEKLFAPNDSFISSCDAVITVGGDGSVIRAAKAASAENKMILGVNAGNLAYLCGLDDDELPLLSGLLTGDYRVQERMMLKVDLIENGQTVFSDICINDVVFATENIKLVDLSVKANGKPIADYIADGVIFATPTGSTAYSMSAGGPIVEPTLDAFIVTPVSPHSLYFRPYIFSDDTVFEVRGREVSGGDIFFSCDGCDGIRLSDTSTVQIRKADIKASFITMKSDNFIDVLNRKLELRK